MYQKYLYGFFKGPVNVVFSKQLSRSKTENSPLSYTLKFVFLFCNKAALPIGGAHWCRSDVRHKKEEVTSIKICM